MKVPLDTVAPEPQQLDQPTTAEPARPVGFGDVAKRITSRTTDFLAICIVLVATLTTGRQIFVWWHVVPPSESAAQSTEPGKSAWEADQQPVALEFGDLPVSVTRQIVSGEPAAVLAALVRNCETATRVADHPLRERDETEDHLLERLADSRPAAEESGTWQVHVVDDRFLLVAGLRRLPGGQSGDAARSEWRLVCWGIGMPAGAQTWTTFVMRGTGGPSSVGGGTLDVPIPPDSRRSLSLKDERGAALVGFSGTGEPDRWMQFYDRWFTSRGWTLSDGWSVGQEVWSARFAAPGSSDRERVEIRFARDRRGELAGLWQVIQPASID